VAQHEPAPLSLQPPSEAQGFGKMTRQEERQQRERRRDATSQPGPEAENDTNENGEDLGEDDQKHHGDLEGASERHPWT
jgi:hypothetical protein